ncbi:MAG TPA: GntP family permease [Mucilaginibacter sp.]|jgi:GntP family gluconate:H+ symporter|nr:GntP family permease [Mucilaginibacter sp.]
MTHSLPYILSLLVAGIAIIVLLTTRFKIPAFFALLTACLVVGLGIGLPLADVVGVIKDGFGNIMKSLGLIIVLGTTLGLLLEYTGSTTVMASALLKILGSRYASWAMGITGFVVGLPIFCDSGFIVLSGLNKTIAKRTGIPLATMSVSLATGLYAVHCLIPPHPGSSAAAAALGVDFGRLILIGALTAIPAMVAGNLWANYAGRKTTDTVADDHEEISGGGPSLITACLPVFVPIVLIAIKSFLSAEHQSINSWLSIFNALGDPVIALLIGVLLVLGSKKDWTRTGLSRILQESAEKAGGILVIIGMGGAFGAVLTATKIGDHLSQSAALGGMGLFFPFLLTSVLKTAQGSSTVAIITASSLILPLLPSLGLTTANDKLLCILSMGAGSMMISHANDAYFWVISKFSGLEMKTMLRVYSIASIFMGLTTFLVVYLLSKIL